jgi:hypothetical protein
LLLAQHLVGLPYVSCSSTSTRTGEYVNELLAPATPLFQASAARYDTGRQDTNRRGGPWMCLTYRDDEVLGRPGRDGVGLFGRRPDYPGDRHARGHPREPTGSDDQGYLRYPGCLETGRVSAAEHYVTLRDSVGRLDDISSLGPPSPWRQVPSPSPLARRFEELVLRYTADRVRAASLKSSCPLCIWVSVYKEPRLQQTPAVEFTAYLCVVNYRTLRLNDQVPRRSQTRLAQLPRPG